MAKKKKTSRKKKAKAPGKRVGRQRGAPPADMPKLNSARKKQGKLGGRPRVPISAKAKPGSTVIDEALDAAILEMAEEGSESEDIALILSLDKRLTDDSELRTSFERLVELGKAKLRTAVARRIIADSKKGKVTAQTKVAEAYLERFMDDAPLRDFASGADERILAEIKKAKGSLKDRKLKRVAEKERGGP